jgi:hypothetical protein
VKDWTIACYAVGFDPYLGYYHQPRFGRPALALDLMEPFRPLIADSAVLAAINTRMVTPKDFVQAGPAVALTPAGRRAFFRSYGLRMDSLVTHPLFEYRVSYLVHGVIQKSFAGQIPSVPDVIFVNMLLATCQKILPDFVKRYETKFYATKATPRLSKMCSKKDP